MLKGFFQLARSAGGFAYYGAANRLPALYYLDFNFVALVTTAGALAALLLVLLPALNGRRTALALGGVLLAGGVALGYARLIPEWQVARRRASGVALGYWPGAPRLNCDLWMGIGLHGANVTLSCDGRGHPYYNEHLEFDDQVEALRRSMVAPVLSAMIPLTGYEGISVRRAGYFASFFLWAATATWAWASLLLFAVPGRAASKAFRLATVTSLATPVVYHFAQPAHPSALSIAPGLRFHYGASFWACLAAAFAAAIAAAVVEVTVKEEDTFCAATCAVGAGRRRRSSSPVPETIGNYLLRVPPCEYVVEKESPHKLGIQHTKD